MSFIEAFLSLDDGLAPAPAKVPAKAKHDHDDDHGASLGPSRLATPEAAKAYALAGDAVVTLRSELTGRHYTYEIAAPSQKRADAAWGDKPPVWFVRVRIEGQERAAYMGMVDNFCRLRLTTKSKFHVQSPSFLAFKFFADHVLAGAQMPPKLQVWHEGSCGRCGRALTHPESLERGIGPVCAGRMG